MLWAGMAEQERSPWELRMCLQALRANGSPAALYCGQYKRKCKLNALPHVLV